MNITIKINKEMDEILNDLFIKMHDEFLSENKESVFDWVRESENSETVKYALSFENLSKDGVQYVLETLEMLRRRFNG